MLRIFAIVTCVSQPTYKNVKHLSHHTDCRITTHLLLLKVSPYCTLKDSLQQIAEAKRKLSYQFFNFLDPLIAEFGLSHLHCGHKRFMLQTMQMWSLVFSLANRFNLMSRKSLDSITQTSLTKSGTNQSKTALFGLLKICAADVKKRAEKFFFTRSKTSWQLVNREIVLQGLTLQYCSVSSFNFVHGSFCSHFI